MDYSHDFVAQAGYAHDFALPAQTDPLQPRYHHDFDQSAMQDPSTAYAMAAAAQKLACDVKPRLTKEQHDILESHYQNQQKPNTSTKRGFAEALNVSLEKVNNWFQNRRAKSKQDAKKQQGSVGIFTMPQPNNLGVSASDSDTSPAFASPEYLHMMQQCHVDESLHSDMPASFHPQLHLNSDVADLSSVPSHEADSAISFNIMHAMANDILETNPDVNRRTLTQEQFDAFTQHDMMLNSGDLAALSADPEALSRILAGFNANKADMMLQGDLSENQSAEDAILGFPVSSMMQEHAYATSSSEWDDSRSSSVSLSQSADHQPHVSSQPVHISPQQSQWQPGSSVPVDVDQLHQEFREVAQARENPQFQQVSEDQTLLWPSEHSLGRRDSSTSLITQSMGNVGIHTPQPQQQAHFKSPAPTSGLAARRQKQRPAPLGLASLRSQSYSGSIQSAVPSHMPASSLSTPPQLRRIKSSNVVGGVAQGRVQKNVAPPQRSPLNWSFADTMNVSQAMRYPQSSSALAPPTPSSPSEQLTAEQIHKAQQHWQSASGHVNQQASISETDAEHAIFAPPASATGQNFSSPPHTPMFNVQQQQQQQHQQHQFFPPQTMPGTVIMENTPPQSAPASQQTFPTSIFGPSPPHAHQFQHHSMGAPPPPSQQQLQHVFAQQQQPHMMMPEQQLQLVPASAPISPQFTVTTSGPQMDIPLQFAQNGLPIVDPQGQMQVAMPSQLQFVQQKIPRAPSHKPQSSKQLPPGSEITFASKPAETMPIQITAGVPKHSQHSSDFFVHEYTPPQEVKRSATPRKPVDNGPKNYTFANQTPEHFEKGKKAESKSSSGSSPESVTSA